MIHDAKLIGHGFQRLESTSSQSQGFSHLGDGTEGLSCRCQPGNGTGEKYVKAARF